MAQDFERTITKDIDASLADIRATANSDDAIVGIRLANTHTAQISVDVVVADNSDNITAYIVKEAPLPVGSSLELIDGGSKIILQSGDKLNQLRLIYKKHNYLNDNQIMSLNKKNKIVFSIKKSDYKIENGLKVSVNLFDDNKIVAFRAKKNAPLIDFRKINFHKITDFWIPIYSKKNYILIEKNKFYILRSKEKIRIPDYLAGEMIPYDTRIGDFRAHYAGFFDPGFGDPEGSFAVLEVKTNELPFILEDGQTIARIKYEKLNKKSNIVYGFKIKSNYQNQGLKLSKHFIENYE